MIAISSPAPHSRSKQVAANQIRARNSWEVLDRIIYVGNYEEELDGENTEFVPGEDYPTIRSLCQLAEQQDCYTCIINADIVLGTDFGLASAALKRSGAKCAISRRYDLWSGKLEDLGLDFFAAEPSVWGMAGKQVPVDYRIGHPIWDTWMLSFFTHQPGIRCADLTPAKVIFHPKHSDRVQPHSITSNNHPLLGDVRWPMVQITNVTNAKGHFTVR